MGFEVGRQIGSPAITATASAKEGSSSVMSEPPGAAGKVGKLKTFLGRSLCGAGFPLGRPGFILQYIRNTSSIYWLYVEIYLFLI